MCSSNATSEFVSERIISKRYLCSLGSGLGGSNMAKQVRTTGKHRTFYGTSLLKMEKKGEPVSMPSILSKR